MSNAEESLVEILKESSIVDIYTSEGIFTTKYSKEDFESTVNRIKEFNKEMAKDNTELLTKTKTRAKTLLEEYIKNVGEGIGESYTVEWKDAE